MRVMLAKLRWKIIRWLLTKQEAHDIKKSLEQQRDLFARAAFELDDLKVPALADVVASSANRYLGLSRRFDG